MPDNYPDKAPESILWRQPRPVGKNKSHRGAVRRYVKCLAYALLMLCGCATTTVIYTPLQSAPHPLAPTYPAVVDVLKREPTRSYLTIGLIDIEPGSDLVDNDYYTGTDPGAARLRVEARLRAEAAKRGCDAVIVHHVIPPNRGPVVYRCGCIVFTDAATTSR